jgi:hypothetical protein
MLCPVAHAADTDIQTPHSPNLYGALGLNTIPSARMDAPGTVRAGVSTLDPYAHSWLGLQIAKPLSITLRQSAEISSLKDDALSLNPGIDLKLRLFEETRARPEISLGLQSTFGHKRLSGEYLTFSKRYKSFDFTGGIGWGRYAGGGDITNPLSPLSSHFDGPRSADGENPSRSADWFSGDKIGLFGGVEYFTPIEGLSLKLDYNDDPYTAERANSDFDAPAPWSAALNYKPRPWADLSIGIQGTDKIMARLSLQSLLNNWRRQDAQISNALSMRTSSRAEHAHPEQMENDAAYGDTTLYEAQSNDHTAHARLMLEDGRSTPRQLSSALTAMANHAGPKIEKLTVTPTVLGLKGPAISVMRRDLEQAYTRHQGSAEEIWHKTEFTTDAPADSLTRRPLPPKRDYNFRDIRYTLDNQISLSEEDNGTLYRTSLLAQYQAPDALGFLHNFASLRLNINDNLEGLALIRPQALLPVRSNIDDFTLNRVNIDRLFSAYTHSFRSDLHLSLMTGYLEEMYGGFGGEILYRPFNSRFAIGAESWLALKRDPESVLATGYNGDHILTGHLNGWYDLPLWDTTLKASVGRYLAGDAGFSLGLQKEFSNGAKLETFMSLSNQSEPDVLGGTTHDYHGVRLSLPLGGFAYAPRNSDVRFEAGPLGREFAQRLDNPLPLYDLTQPFSMNHIESHWDEITP